MNGFSDFNDYTSHDFAANESFQSYVIRQRKEDIQFWEDFIRRNPGKQAEMEEAVEILSLLAFKKIKISAGQKELELTRLLFSTGRFEKNKKRIFSANINEGNANPQHIFDHQWSRLAASISGLLILFSAVFFFSNRSWKDNTITYQTSFGENTTFILPDSSVVILNGNTRLTHQAGWNGKNKREVWLDGEAFFDVRHKGQSENALFVVHTPGMDVEVLGTKFNVFNREDKTNVVLNSGKVKINIASQHDTSTVMMMPDELVEYFRKDRLITKRQVNAEVLTSWRNKVLVFENTPLYKIRDIIEDTYGVHVIFRSNVDAGEKLAGTIPSDNLDVLLTVLAKSSNLHITRNKDQIIIEKKDPVSSQHEKN
jgi:transmembrane sensor